MPQDRLTEEVRDWISVGVRLAECQWRQRFLSILEKNVGLHRELRQSALLVASERAEHHPKKSKVSLLISHLQDDGTDLRMRVAGLIGSSTPIPPSQADMNCLQVSKIRSAQGVPKDNRDTNDQPPKCMLCYSTDCY